MEKPEIKLKAGKHYKVEIYYSYIYGNGKEKYINFDFYALRENSGFDDIKNSFHHRYTGVEILRIGNIVEAEELDDFLERLQQCF